MRSRGLILTVALLLGFLLVSCGGTSEAFDFDSDNLCERINSADMMRIVSDVYTEYGAAPGPQPFEVSWDSDAYQGCAWESSEENSEDATFIGLISTEPVGWYEQWVEIDDYFHPHAGLSDSVWVGGGGGQPPIHVGKPGEWIPGIEVRLLVEGRDQTLEYWVGVPVGFEGNAEPLLAIADRMLQLMGWLPDS